MPRISGAPFFSILTASFPSIPRFNIKVISFAITILLSKFYYRTGSLRLGYESKIPLNHHSHQPTKLRRLFLSSPPSSPSSVFSVKIVVLSKISTFSFITIALIDIFCIFAEDKLHSAEYSSKLDILRSFALSLQKISCISAKRSNKLDAMHSICMIHT